MVSMSMSLGVRHRGADDDGEQASPAIPTGVYKLSWYASPKHGGQEVPLLHDVPWFNMVEIHTGNTEADTEGCLLFGLRRTQTSVSESRKAIAWLYDHLRKAGLGTIEITRE